MKNTLALTALIASAGLASAGNLRAPAKVTLDTERCGKGSKPLGCCATPGEKDANGKPLDPLYLKTKDSKYHCCSKSLSMWMPTQHEKNNDKFCSLGMEAALAKTSMANVNSLTDKMVYVLDRLNKDKHNLKDDFRKAYIAHTDKEDKLATSIEKKKAAQLKELKYLNDKQSQTSSDLTRAQEILKKNQEAQVAIEANFQKDSDALEKQISAAEKAANDLEKAQQKELDHLTKVKESLKKCKSDNKDLEKMKKSVEENLAAAKAAQEAAKKAEADMKKEHEAKQKEAEAKKKALMAKQKELEDKKADMVKYIEKTKARIASINEAIENYEPFPGFIELSIRPSICDDECQKYRAWDSSKYMNANDEKMMDDAKKYVNSELEGLHSVLKEIKAVKARVKDLKALDEELHKKIMADLFSDGKNKKLEKDIKDATEELQKTLEKIESAKKANTDVVKANEELEASNLADLEKRRACLAKIKKDEEKVSQKLEEIKVSLQLNRKMLDECGAVSKSLATEIKQAESKEQEANEKAQALQAANEDMKNKYDDLEQESKNANSDLERKNGQLDEQYQELKEDGLKKKDEAKKAAVKLAQMD